MPVLREFHRSVDILDQCRDRQVAADVERDHHIPAVGGEREYTDRKVGLSGRTQPPRAHHVHRGLPVEEGVGGAIVGDAERYVIN